MKRVVIFFGLLKMDRFASPSDCWKEAALCRIQADAAADEQLRALWISMEQMWTKVAAHRERLQRLNTQVSV